MIDLGQPIDYAQPLVGDRDQQEWNDVGHLYFTSLVDNMIDQGPDGYPSYTAQLLGEGLIRPVVGDANLIHATDAQLFLGTAAAATGIVVAGYFGASAMGFANAAFAAGGAFTITAGLNIGGQIDANIQAGRAWYQVDVGAAVLEGTVSAYTSVVLGGVFAKVGTPVLNAAFGKLSSRFSCATNTVVLRGAAAAPGLVEMGYGVYEISRGNVATGLMHIGAGAAGIFGASRISGLCFVAGTEVWLERPHATLAAAGVGPGMGHDHTFVVILASGIAVAVVGQRVIEARAERKRKDEETEEEAVDVFNTTRRPAVDRRCDEDDDGGNAWAADWWRTERAMRENDEHLDELAARIAAAEYNADPRDLAFAGYARERGGAPSLTVPSRAVERPRANSRPRDLSLDRERTMTRRNDLGGKRHGTRPIGSRLGRAWLFGVLLLTALLSIKFLPTGTPSRTGGPTALASARYPAPAADCVTIENVDCGERTIGRNPLREQVDESQLDPDPETWRLLKLRMVKQNGMTLWVDLLRPLDWIELTRAERGGTIFLDLPEMGAVGDAEVLNILPCPPIQPGTGAVVTGKFVHEADGTNVIALRLEGQSEPTGVTDNHPYWSIDRQAFIPAGELRPDERLDTLFGETRVVTIERIDYHGLLYNLETTEHVYRISDLAVLVHNACHHSIPKFLGGKKKQRPTILSNSVHTEFHQLLSAGLKSRGLPPMGGKTGSTAVWRTFMQNNKGAQRSA
jgi:hypothetical protein